MKYYLIAGEASGDLHASHLIAALKAEDPAAQFRGFGGDLMQQQGLELVRHYRDLAYMGLVAVVMHLRTILRGMKQCREDIAAWRPDVVILVDYPGFNLKMARYVHDHALCPVYYYIAPKLWAWKEWRIKDIRRNVDEIFSILPFEVAFFEGKHHFPIHYVGNPTVDEVENYKCIVHSAEVHSAEVHSAEVHSAEVHSAGVHSAGVHSAGVHSAEVHSAEVHSAEVHSAGVHSAEVHSAEVHSDTFAENNPESQQSLCTMHSSTMHSKDYIALLSGSRTHEIRDNLPRMIAAAEPFMKDYRLIVAGAPSIPLEHYQKYIGNHPVEVVYGRTYDLLSGATAALVTSGTATLETALFRVPQVVCYFMQFRQIASFLRRLLIKVKYISLVNLIADREVVPELVADHMTVKACRRHLASILPGGEARQAQLRGYEEVARRLGDPGAPHRAALQILQCLQTAKPVKTNMQTS